MIRNAVLAKELRSRVRTWRSPFLISIYLGILGGVAFAYYYLLTNQPYGGMGPEVGLTIYTFLAIFQLLLIVFVTPGMTAGVISNERERQTFDLLLCTRLSATSIVLGKLASAMSYLFLLILTSIPLFSIVFLFGGVSPKELALTFAVYVMTAITLGAIGIFCSAIIRKTQIGTVLTYAMAFFLIVGTLLIGVFWDSYRQSKNLNQGPYPPPPPIIVYFNPAVALVSAMPIENRGNPFMEIFGRYAMYRKSMTFYSAPAAATRVSAVKMGMTTPAPTYPPPKIPKLEPWQFNFIFDAIIIFVLMTVTVFLIQPVRPWPWVVWRRRKMRRELAHARQIQA